MEAMASYLQKRRQRWYAVLEIPAAVRSHFRKKARFVQSLGTDSHAVAQQRVGPIIAAWRSEIARAKPEPKDEAAFYRAALHRAKSALKRATTADQRAAAEKQHEIVLYEIEMAAWDIGAMHVDPDGRSPSSDPAARRFYRNATAAAFTDHLEEWLATWPVAEKTKAMARSDATKFAQRFPVVPDVTRKGVKGWTADLIQGGRSASTVRRSLAALRTYWRHLQSNEVAEDDHNPFDGLRLTGKAGGVRKPFEAADVVKLLSAAIEREDGRLADLIRLAMYSGARLEELASLKVADMAKDHFTIRAAKTEAGNRVVPIHRKLAQTIARLIEQSDDGYVLSGLGVTKYGDRGDGIGKRFGRLKRELGYGPEHVFHSIRRTVVTILENAGVSENVVANIVGHEKPRITYGLYSGGATLAVKHAALAKLAYPKGT